jgi:hypothetical protein
MLTLTENDPFALTVAPPTETGVLCSTIETEPPGKKLFPLTVNEPPGGTAVALVLIDAALGPYAKAGVLMPNPNIATTEKSASLPFMGRPL